MSRIDTVIVVMTDDGEVPVESLSKQEIKEFFGHLYPELDYSVSKSLLIKQLSGKIEQSENYGRREAHQEN